MKTKPLAIRKIQLGKGIPDICVPVTGRSEEEILAQMREVVPYAPDLIEWRADYFDSVLDLPRTATLLSAIRDTICDIPLIFTFRTKEEGGMRHIPISDYVNLNRAVAETHLVDLIDVQTTCEEVEKQRLVRLIHDAGVYVIGSFHDFEKTPAQKELISILLSIEKSGADVLKIAVMPHSKNDTYILLAATEMATREITTHPVVTISMGQLGRGTRICGEIFGSAMTFATVGEASAPGQIPIEELRSEMFRLHKTVETI